MTISEKSAYIKGLADGLDYDKESAEGKLITALIDIVGEMAGCLLYTSVKCCYGSVGRAHPW